MHDLRRLLIAIPFLLTATLASNSAMGDDDDDHDAARKAVEHGEILPLDTILSGVKDELPGQIVGVEIEQKQQRWFYEFRVVGAQGHLYEVYVDARTGKIEKIKEK